MHVFVLWEEACRKPTQSEEIKFHRKKAQRLGNLNPFLMWDVKANQRTSVPPMAFLVSKTLCCKMLM